MAGAIAIAAGALTMMPAAARAQERTAADWLARCRDQGDDDREAHCEIRTAGMRAGGSTIAVEPGENGGAVVEGWDRDSIHIEARIRATAPSADRARELARGVRIDTGAGTIHAEGPEPGRRASWSVVFYVMVPRRSDLRLEAVNGPLAVTRVSGRLRLRAENGPVSLTGVGGDVRVRAENGPLAVRLEGTTWQGEGLDAATQNGPVTLSIPDRYDAELTTGTQNGPMRIDFPITLRGRIERTLTTTLGTGGPPVRVVTTNGPVIVKRG
jgi:hypothetical protein